MKFKVGKSYRYKPFSSERYFDDTVTIKIVNQYGNYYTGVSSHTNSYYLFNGEGEAIGKLHDDGTWKPWFKLILNENTTHEFRLVFNDGSISSYWTRDAEKLNRRLSYNNPSKVLVRKIGDDSSIELVSYDKALKIFNV